MWFHGGFDSFRAHHLQQLASYQWLDIPGICKAGSKASYSGGSLQYFRHADWQGTFRFDTDAINGTVFADVARAPYGEEYAVSGPSYEPFAELTESIAGDLFDTQFREYHPGQGRWISPDPAGLVVVDPSNPQSWNRYAYVANNPLSTTDPSGLLPFGDDGCDPDYYNCAGGAGVGDSTPPNVSIVGTAGFITVYQSFDAYGNVLVGPADDLSVEWGLFAHISVPVGAIWVGGGQGLPDGPVVEPLGARPVPPSLPNPKQNKQQCLSEAYNAMGGPGVEPFVNDFSPLSFFTGHAKGSAITSVAVETTKIGVTYLVKTAAAGTDIADPALATAAGWATAGVFLVPTAAATVMDIAARNQCSAVK